MDKFMLAPYVRVGFLEGNLHFGFGSLRQLIQEKEIQNCLLDASVFLKQPRKMDEVSSFLKESGHHLNAIKQSMEILKKNFLMPEGIYNSVDRHSRSLLFYSLSGAEVNRVQKKISYKKIAIVGCGGIGNVMGVLLATAGIGEFLLVDNDRIEISNLSRQIMFTEEDCGQYKSSILAKALKERFSSIKITEIKEFITYEKLSILKDCDFILVSGDQGNVLDIINTFAIENEIPFLNVGYVEDIAVWGPLVVPGDSGCYSCRQHLVNAEGLKPEQIDKCREINRGYQSPSNGPINMMASSFATLDILKFLGQFGEIQSLNTRIGIWSHDLHIEKQDYNLNPECKVCGPLQRKIR